MSIPVAQTGPTFGPLAQRSVQFVPRVHVVQSENDVIPCPNQNHNAHAQDITHVITPAGRPPGGAMMHSEGDLPLSSSNRVLLNRNVAARHALQAQNHDLSRQFERVMAAHAAQQRLLQAELRALHQCTSSATSGLATASAVDLSAVMSGQHHHHHHLSSSNGKYFVSPFNRHKSRRGDPSSAVSLPPPSSSSMSSAAAEGLTAADAQANLLPPPKTQAAMSTVRGETMTTMATTSGLHVATTASPSLKLRQTAGGGLKLQPVTTSQVSSALSSMKTHGGKPVRVKVQLKVKLPPLKTGHGQGMVGQPDPGALQGQEVGPTQKKQVIRLKATTAPKDFPRDDNSKFGTLRKIDILFAGERAASRASTESAKSAETPNDNTLVLRCADGTLCRVPIGGTRKLQQLVATRGGSNILSETDEGSDALRGRHLLKSCLKKPTSRTRYMKSVGKKTVRFAPDTIEVNRESKVTEVNPTVKIGSQLYTLKLPSIKSVKRNTPPTTDRYTVRAVSLRPKNKEEFARLRRDELESIQESDESSSIMTDEDLSTVSSTSPESGTERPNTARASSRSAMAKSPEGAPVSKFTDMVLSVAMKRKKKLVSPDVNSPASSPVMTTEGASPRLLVSPTNSTRKYVVSKSQDRWKVTIKNS